MSDTTTPADEASEIRQGFTAIKSQIEEDRTLSDEGKAAAITAARDDANAKIDAIRAGVEGDIAAERSSLELRLLAAPSAPLGSPTDKIAHTASYRDAIGRAGMTTTPAELLDLQRTALLTGDTLLARATMVVGLKRGDAEVVNGWSAANPKLEGDIDRLWELTHTKANIRNDIAAALAFGKAE